MMGITYYEREMKQMRARVYRNGAQLDVIIGTRRYISTHYYTEISLDHLAKCRHTSKYHLLRLFKRYYGQTPQQFLTDVRIAKSKIYLEMGRSISATCYAVGFQSPSSFSTLFKCRTGRSPIDFQKEQLSLRRSSSDIEILQGIKMSNHENTGD